MLSHGGHARELNLWASKLRNYNSKHFHRVDRTRKCTLYGEASNQSEMTPASQTTDLQRCVQLLSHLLETDGSLMGGPGARKQVPKRSAKPKKKRVHVVPQAKLLGKNVVGRASGVRGSLGRTNANVKKTSLHSKAAPAGRHQLTRNEVLATGEQTGGNAKHEDVTQPAPQQQSAGSDVSEPVPYNTRLASSTPNNTLLKELTSEYPVSCDAHVSSPQAKNPGLYKGNVNSASAKKNTHDCKQFSKNAPDLPLVFLNKEYNLTPGQSNPLNSSSQVNIMHPPEVKPVPKLIQGKVDFVPNPCAWFQVNKSNSAQRSGNTIQNVAASSGIQQPWDLQCEAAHQQQQPAHPLDPPEREVNFSLYTNPGDGNIGAEIGQHGAPPSASLQATQEGAAQNREPTECHYPAAVNDPLMGEKSSSQTKSTSSVSSCNVDVIEIPTGMRKSISETSVKRLAKKDSNSSNSRFTKTNKKRHSVKNKDGTFKKTPKVKSTVDKAVQFAINNAATQCSPESDHETEMLNLLNICTDPCMSQQSMRHMMTLQCLLEDMKALAKSEQNPKLDLLVKQVEQTAAMFVPGLGGVDWRTELELAIQPLRSENAQLRRRLRITNQQMKEIKYQLEHNDKPDPSFHTVHLELLQQKLKQDCEELKSSRDKLRDRLKESQADLEKVRAERAKLLEIMINKDAERHKAEQKWNEDVARHRRDTERALEETNRALRERDILQKQLQLVHISLDQRDKEIARLRNIVRNLQDSMRGLLNKLKTVTPPEELLNTFTDGGGNNLLDRDVLLDDEENSRTPTDFHSDGVTGLNTASSHTSARRVLPFSERKSQKQSSPGQRHDPKTANVTSSPKQEEANHDHHTGDTDDMKWNDDSLNDTDYIAAPGTSPMKKLFTHRTKLPAGFNHQSHICNGAPTVKELLTPLKDRLQTQYKRLSAGSHGKSHEARSEMPSVPVVPEEECLADLEVAPLDGTLCDDASDSDENQTLEVNVAQDEGDATGTKASSDEVSRYSITDYFKKYQHEDSDTLVKKASDNLEMNAVPKPGISSDVKVESVNSVDDDGIDADCGETGQGQPSDLDSHSSQLVTPDSGKPKTHSSNGQNSFQDGVYKGTALETSISTISDIESVASSAMTLSSVGTIDDSNFQQGLADLDANIARIQAQLQASLAQYS